MDEVIMFLVLCIGVMLGMVVGMIFIHCYLHKIWYNSWIPKSEHLPFSRRIKEKVGMKEGEYLK